MRRKQEPKQGPCKAANPRCSPFPKREKEMMRERRVMVPQSSCGRSGVKKEGVLGPPGKEARLEHLWNWLWTVPTRRTLMVLRGFLSKARESPGILLRMRKHLVFSLSCPLLLSPLLATEPYLVILEWTTVTTSQAHTPC